jgi:hypothetical protein
MGIFQNYRILSFLVLIIALLWCFSPVLADNGSISITYRGSGGSYIGDLIIFDGYNTVGNTTILQITGPGLPAAGVPIYNLNGATGAGTPVEVNPDGSWKFVWYTANIQGINQMQTARYYITAFDLSNPAKNATTSIMMAKREFYAVPTPNTVETGDYIQLLGYAEGGAPDIHIEIQDMSGNVIHVYNTAATNTGDFNYDFHIDMPPGDYPVLISSATMKTSYQTIIHVIPPQTLTLIPTTVLTPTVTQVLPVSQASTGLTVTPAVASNTAPASLSPLTIIAGLITAGLVVLLILVLGRKI